MVDNAIKRVVESLKNPIFNMGFCNFEYIKYSDNHYFKTGFKGFYKITFKRKYNNNYLNELLDTFKNNKKFDFYYLDLILKNSDVKRWFMYNHRHDNFNTARDNFNLFIIKCLEKEIEDSKIEYKIEKL
jgi:hypothetical protein